MNQLLVLSQEPRLQGSWTSLLGQRGYRVALSSIERGAQFVGWHDRPELVILDIHARMPLAQALNALELLVEEHPDVPVLVLSPREWPEMHTRLLQKRADAQLLKPTDYATLLRLVDMFVSHRVERPAKQEPALHSVPSLIRV